mgnify:CR=1 FL=1
MARTPSSWPPRAPSTRSCRTDSKLGVGGLGAGHEPLSGKARGESPFRGGDSLTTSGGGKNTVVGQGIHVPFMSARVEPRYSSTVDIVYQFLPVLIANGYHMVTVSHLLGDRAPGTSYGGRENGPPVNDIHDIPPAQIPVLPATPSPQPAPNLPITDIAGQNPGGPQ